MAWQPDYITVSDLKTWVGETVSSWDTVIPLAIAAASRAVDQFCNRQFGLSAVESRLYTAEWDRYLCRWIIPVDDIMSPAVTGLTATITAGTLTVTPRPLNEDVKGRPYQSLAVDTDSAYFPCGTEGEVTVTTQFGWTSVPSAVKQATTIQATRLLLRKDSPFGVTGSPDMAGELRLLAKIDADVSVVLQPYVRWWAAV